MKKKNKDRTIEEVKIRLLRAGFFCVVFIIAFWVGLDYYANNLRFGFKVPRGYEVVWAENADTPSRIIIPPLKKTEKAPWRILRFKGGNFDHLLATNGDKEYYLTGTQLGDSATVIECNGWGLEFFKGRVEKGPIGFDYKMGPGRWAGSAEVSNVRVISH